MIASTHTRKTFLLYGAYGYTGRLIARYAKDYNLEPILSGRNEGELKKMSDEMGYDYLVLDLDDKEALHRAMLKSKVILHCGGPFIHTFQKVAEACLETGTHYLDITGEINVFEGLARMNEPAMKEGVQLLPGVGFDVVPSDCLAAYLKSRLPDAVSLTLAILSGGGISRGTLNTAIENLKGGGMIRKNGILQKVNSAYKVKKIDFGNGPLTSVTIPWGDVSTAYYSTGIPNIEVYLANPPLSPFAMKLSGYMGWLLDSGPVKNFLKTRIKKGSPGPSDAARAKNNSMVWGQVMDKEGQMATALFKGPEGYTLTAHTGLMAVKKVLDGLYKPGFQTASSAFGMDFILELEGTTRWDKE